MHSVTIAEIKNLLNEKNAKEISLRIARPENWNSDPRKPTLVIPGIGAIAVHGGNHLYLVVTLKLEALEAADGTVVITSPDLDLEVIRSLK